MTYEDFYAQDYERLKEAEKTLLATVEKLKADGDPAEDLQPIVYCCSRIKRPDSMIAKLEGRGLPATREAALHDVYDAVGVRIICSFASDVFHIVEQLEQDPSLEILEKKNYLSRPKPNGYRSIHLCLRLKDTGVLAEIQIRTIAMDFWATLEHQVKYKKSIPDEALIRKELKRCADEIASVDLSMQTIREIIKEL